MAALSFALASLVLVWPCASQADEPILRVRARTRILADTISLSDGVLVKGTTIDTHLRSGLPNRELLVTARRHGRSQSVTTRTDAFGRFRVRLPLGPGRHTIHIRTTEDAYHAAAELNDPRVEITTPIPRWWLTLPPCATAAMLLLWGLVRLRVARRRRRETPARATSATPSPGLRLAHAGRRHALQPRADADFTGHVVDLATGRPVAAASITLEPDAHGAIPVLETDLTGRFGVVRLPPGRYRVTVHAAGYLDERFAIGVPHRGELSGARVDLMPVRLRVLDIYREVALALLPTQDLLWVWTPHELLQRSDAGPSLAALTRLVEEITYSGRLGDESVITRAEGLAGEIPRPVGAPT
jgi:5-hydroxyisourate hydrolase-like protein (transthyretin family)